MPQSLMVYTFPKLVIADTQAGLDTAVETYECQVTAATIDPTVAFATVPSTGCTGPSQSPGTPSWTLNLAWLQDWAAPAGGLSGYAFTNRNTQKWVRLVPDKNDVAVAGEGQVWIAPGRMGGTFGDGSAGVAEAAWQFIGEPSFDFPATTVAADTADTAADDAVAV